MNKLKLPDKLINEGINSQAKIMYEEFIRQLNLQDKAFNDFKERMNKISSNISDPDEATAALLCNEVMFTARVLKFFSNNFFDQVEEKYNSGELFDQKMDELIKAKASREYNEQKGIS